MVLDAAACVPGDPVEHFGDRSDVNVESGLFANLAHDRPATPDTVFMLASISKTVMAVAAMQAVEEGLLDLDADVDDALPYMQPSSSVQMLFVGGKPSGVQLPASVELGVTETEPGVKGDTVSNVTKPATLETGAVVQVPLFVNVGDRIKVDPREARYISRA